MASSKNYLTQWYINASVYSNSVVASGLVDELGLNCQKKSSTSSSLSNHQLYTAYRILYCHFSILAAHRFSYLLQALPREELKHLCTRLDKTFSIFQVFGKPTPSFTIDPTSYQCICIPEVTNPPNEYDYLLSYRFALSLWLAIAYL